MGGFNTGFRTAFDAPSIGSSLPSPAAKAGGGIGSWAKKIGSAGVLGIGGALGGLFSGMGENKKAKINTENENKMNAYNNKLSRGQYQNEDMYRLGKRSKSTEMRRSIGASLVKANPGLAKILGNSYGLDKGAGSIAYNTGNVGQERNIYDTAGPVPTLKAATGGWQGAVGGALKGIFG